jgi:hypothetical protein
MEKSYIFNWKILVLAITIVAVIITYIIITIIVNVNYKTNEQGLPENKNELTFRECLEKEDYSQVCENLFLDPSNYLACENIGELRDKCFYRLAINSERDEICDKISDNALKIKCKLNLPTVH